MTALLMSMAGLWVLMMLLISDIASKVLCELRAIRSNLEKMEEALNNPICLYNVEGLEVKHKHMGLSHHISVEQQEDETDEDYAARLKAVRAAKAQVTRSTQQERGAV